MSRYQPQHRAPTMTALPGRLPVAGSLATLVVAGGTFAAACTAADAGNAAWENSAPAPSSAAQSPTSTRNMTTVLPSEQAGDTDINWVATQKKAAQAAHKAAAHKAAAAANKATPTPKPAAKTAAEPAPKQAAKKAAAKPAPKRAAAKPAPRAAKPAPPAVKPPRAVAFNPATYDWKSVGGPSKATAGDVKLSTPGASIANCNISTLRPQSTGHKVSHCTIKGGVFGSGSYTIEHSFITSNADGLDPTGSGYKVIQYNKIWRDGSRVGDKHQDGIQFWKGGNALISHNWIGGFHTSAIMVKADQATISNVTIDNNYLHNPTGYYQLYLCRDSHDLRNITVTNNAFGKANSTISTCGDNLTFVHTEAQRQAAIKAGNKAAASWIVWNNNYVASTHAVVAPPGGWDK